MATPRSRRAARQRARRRRAQHRARRLALFGILAALAVVTLILTAFGSSSPQRVATTVDLQPAASGVPPEPEILATVSNLQIRLPIAGEAVTAIGFHGSDAGAMELDPVGRQANEGLLARLWRRIAGSSNDGPVWYQLEGGPGTEVLAVGAGRVGAGPLYRLTALIHRRPIPALDPATRADLFAETLHRLTCYLSDAGLTDDDPFPRYGLHSWATDATADNQSLFRGHDDLLWWAGADLAP